MNSSQEAKVTMTNKEALAVPCSRCGAKAGEFCYWGHGLGNLEACHMRRLGYASKLPDAGKQSSTKGEREKKHRLAWSESSGSPIATERWAQIACICGCRWHSDGADSLAKANEFLDAHIQKQSRQPDSPEPLSPIEQSFQVGGEKVVDELQQPGWLGEVLSEAKWRQKAQNKIDSMNENELREMFAEEFSELTEPSQLPADKKDESAQPRCKNCGRFRAMHESWRWCGEYASIKHSFFQPDDEPTPPKPAENESGFIKNKSTSEGKAFWGHVENIAKQVREASAPKPAGDELPPLDCECMDVITIIPHRSVHDELNHLIALLHCRERQLKAERAASREKDEEIARLKAACEVDNDSAVEAWKLTRQWQARVFDLEAQSRKLEAHLATLRARETVEGWIDCKQRMPSDSVVVMVYCEVLALTSMCHWNSYKNWWQRGIEEFPYTVTHWMPITSPPPNPKDSK